MYIQAYACIDHVCVYVCVCIQVCVVFVHACMCRCY